MALRLAFLMAVLVAFCMAQVISDTKVEYTEDQARNGLYRRLLQSLDCGELCKVRCSSSSRPNLCNRACGTCCFRCKCVPPGTSGNREKCGKCYTGMTTHGNRTKCP